MNCWGIRIYFTKSRFSLNGGHIVYMELLLGHEKIITKSGISPNAGTLDWGFTVIYHVSSQKPSKCHGTRVMYYWLNCMHFSLSNIINPLYTLQATEFSAS